MVEKSLRSTLFKLTAGFSLAFAAMTMAFSASAFEARAVTVTFSNLSLTEDGDASWDAEVDDPTYEIDKYQIRLSREYNGKWTESYKTYTTSEDSYEISFSNTGRYYFVVRAKLVGGSYGEWSSESSNIVSVTADDIDRSSKSPGDPGTAYYPVVSSTNSNRYSYGPGGSTSTGTVTASGSGWILDSGGYRYYYANGTYLSSGWDLIDGYWYYFDSDGYMYRGWLYYGNNWYYLNANSGRMAASSWNNINEKWYYFNESGVMQTGYIVVDGNTYYTDNSGARVENTYNPDGHLFDANGVMVS